MPLPVQGRTVELDLDARARRDRRPAMTSGAVEEVRLAGDRARIQLDRAAHAPRDRHRDLVDVDGETGPVPVQRTRADLQALRRAPQRRAPALGHAPALDPAVERDVERIVVERVAVAPPARTRVIRREAAADQRDQGDPVFPVVAEGIDVPPQVAARRHRRVEQRPDPGDAGRRRLVRTAGGSGARRRSTNSVGQRRGGRARVYSVHEAISER